MHLTYPTGSHWSQSDQALLLRIWRCMHVMLCCMSATMADLLSRCSAYSPSQVKLQPHSSHPPAGPPLRMTHLL